MDSECSELEKPNTDRNKMIGEKRGIYKMSLIQKEAKQQIPKH